ncbi:MHYT domain-containing protein [Streptomyces sp. NPDC058691]|uniref:MHYT domain-containing protein n=1 Tax=Streptomyces sp. NPDC058691 TaxID=3346601 RepID=UPI00366259D2
MGGTYGLVDGFSYGWATPVAGYLMACLGAGLGLRCITRALAMDPARRVGWLALGAAAIGSGIWTMHFIGMMGFSVGGVPISYDMATTVASLLVAVLVVGIGVFAVGYLGRTVPAVLAGGVVMGLGIAGMHYLGMRGMRLHADLVYSTPTVALAVGVAVFAATIALWCAVAVRGLYGGLGASLILGLAMSCMHYIGMASVTVHLLNGVREGTGGAGPAAALAPILIGPVVFLLLAGVVVALDPPAPAPYTPDRFTEEGPVRAGRASRAAHASRVGERPGERH